MVFPVVHLSGQSHQDHNKDRKRNTIRTLKVFIALSWFTRRTSCYWGSSGKVGFTKIFGLRSVLIIFTALAHALEWITKQQGVRILLHYLDDFNTVGPPDSAECRANMHKLCELCAELGVPVATEKTVGPTTCLTFLGLRWIPIN